MGQTQNDNVFEIKDTRKRIKIAVDGVEAGEAVYNPSSPHAYKQLLKAMAMTGQIEIPKDIDLTEEEKKLLSSDLESAEEFDKANEIFKRRNVAIQTTVDKLDELYAAVDSIFGDGICELLLTYSDDDNNYFKSLMEIALKDMNRERQVVKNKFKEKQSDVME